MNLSNVVHVNGLYDQGERLLNPWGYSRRGQVRRGSSVSISVDILDVLNALKQCHDDGELPSFLEYLSVTATLYASAKAQGGLSDAEEYDHSIARRILDAQGYMLDFYQCASKPSYHDGKWERGPIRDGKQPDSIVVNASKDYFNTLFDLFESLNRCSGNVWGCERERLLYIPEEIVLFCGGSDFGEASVYLFASDDRNLDEMPHIKVNETHKDALTFLMGDGFKEKEGKYFVGLN